MGLSASYGIIERHGGQIVVVSEPGEGTRFEVRLPLYDHANASLYGGERPDTSKKVARVLFVNDEGAKTIR